jgi:Holliday junction resolvase
MMGLKSTRIESTATAGVPDLCICDKKGFFHFIELKVITAYKVGLRPHQISWLTRHAHASAWVLIRKQKNAESPAELFLYRAQDAIELAEVGVRLEPYLYQPQPFHLDELFKAITESP